MKGQMSVEYIATYSWALVVIAIIVGTLLYYGAFTRDETISKENCDLGPQLNCEEFIIDDSSRLSIKFRNGINDNIHIEDVDTIEGTITCSSGPVTIPPGESGFIYCDLDREVYDGDFESTDLVVKFKTENSVSTFTSKGTVVSQVSGSSSIAPPTQVCDQDMDGIDSQFCGGNDCNDNNNLTLGPACNTDTQCSSQYGKNYVCINDGLCSSYCQLPAPPPPPPPSGCNNNNVCETSNGETVANCPTDCIPPPAFG